MGEAPTASVALAESLMTTLLVIWSQLQGLRAACPYLVDQRGILSDHLHELANPPQEGGNSALRSPIRREAERSH